MMHQVGVSFDLSLYLLIRGALWPCWLRHCATSREVAVSMFDGVIGIFNLPNPSGHAMTVTSTQPIIEMITGNSSFPGRK